MATTGDIFNTAQQLAKNLETNKQAAKQASTKLDTTVDPITTPLTQNVETLRRAQQQAQAQNRASRSVFGLNSALNLNGTIGFSGRLTPDWIDQKYTSVPVELYDSKTGKVTKKYNNILDYQMDTMVVTGGAENKPSMSVGDVVSAVAPSAALWAGMAFRYGPTLGTKLLAGAGGALFGATLAGANLGTQLAQAYNEFWNDPDRKIELLAEKGEDGAYQVSFDKSAYGNKLSGAYTRSLQEGLDEPISWNADGTRLQANVLPAFANSDAYKDAISTLASYHKGLTRDTDTDGEILKQINQSIAGLQSRYYIDQQEASRLKALYPTVSEEAIEISINNHLIGYAQKESDLSAPMYVFNGGITPTESTAKAVLDSIYNLGGDKIAKDKYLARLYGYLADPQVSDDNKAIVEGQIQGIYAASQNKKLKYYKMYEKDWLEYFGEARVLWTSLNDDLAIGANIAIATGIGTEPAYGELKYFYDNQTKKTLTNLGTAAVNFYAAAQAMGFIENAGRSVLSTVSGKVASALPEGLAKNAATWVAANAADSTAFTTMTYATGKELASKAAALGFDFTIQLAADAVYDAAKLGLQAAAGNKIDFFEELTSDAALDLWFTYLHSGEFQKLMAEVFAKNSGQEFGLDALNRIIRENSKVTIDPETGSKTLKFTIEGKKGEKDYEVTLKGDELSKPPATDTDFKGLTADELGTALSKAYYEVNFEAQKKAAQTIVKLSEKFPRLYKGYSTWVDQGIAMKMLGYRKLAETGDYTDLVKISNAVNPVRAVNDAWYRFNEQSGERGLLSLQKAQASFEQATGRKEPNAADAEYINAKQELSRAQQDYGKDTEEYKRAEGLYKKSLTKVSAADRPALDALANALAKIVKAGGEFEVSEGLQTSNFYDMIQKYNGYIPMFAKPRDADGGKPVEYRRVHRTTDDADVKLAPSAFQDPVESTMQYLNSIIRNAARTKQVGDVLDIIAKYSDIEVSEQSTFKQDYEKLPIEKLVEKYDIPKEARAAMHKIADTEQSYKKQMDAILEKNMIQQHVTDYRKAMDGLADSAKYKKWTTTEGDPILRKTYGAYKQGMTEAEIKEVFLENMRESMEGALAGARRHNYKFRKYFSIENPMSRVESFMVKLERNLDKLPDEQIGKMVAEELKQAMPMVSYDELVYNWIDNSSNIRNEELLNDPEILEGKAGYDIKGGRKVKSADAAIRLMTDGRIDTIYLHGKTKEGSEAAKGVASVLNAPLAAPQKNALLRGLQSFLTKTAQLKRNTVSGWLPSRAPVNLTRDTQQAWRRIGASAVLDPAETFKAMLDTNQFSEAELKKVYASLDRVKGLTASQTQNEIAKLYREGAMAQAAALAGRPKAPGFEETLELRGAERTKAQLEYQWKVLQYNANRIGRGGAEDIVMTPGNLAEAATRNRSGQNAFILELRNQLEAGAGVDDAIAKAYERGAWASRLATTDFSTKGTLTNFMARFTPFSYSDFSDLASKIETFVVDPVGTSHRTAISILSYTMNLAAILATDDNRKRYMNMSEYQRTHSMMVDLGDGNLLTIPMDEAMAAVITPFRVFIETLVYKEPVTFWKVFGSFLDLGPLDLAGFTEGDKFNLQRGLETLGDAYLPAALSTAGELITGRDWYYGSKISVDDRDLATYGLTAEGAGDYTQSNKDQWLLHKISDTLNIPQWIIQQVFSLYTGTVGDYALNILDRLTGATENEAYGRDIAQAFYRSFLPSESGASTAFYNGIDLLYEEKKKIQAKLSANWKAQQTATGEALAALQTERRKILDDFAVKTTDFVAGYLQVYEMTGGLSASEANRIYYLFDFTDDFEGGGFNVGTAGSEAYETYKKQMGIQATSLQAQAIGKYYDPKGLYQASDGTWQRETPLGTQAMNREMNNQNQNYAAQINRIAAENNLSRGKSAASNQISAIYNQANAEGRNLTNDEYNQIDAIRAAWDVQAFQALLPFFQANGLDMISSSAVAESLGQYFLVIGDFQKNNKGRYISASNLNKQRGFVQAFVRTVYEKLGIK